LTQNIKQKLLEEPNLIVKILEELGCHKINNKYNGQIRSALPDGNNPTSLQIILNENLSTIIYSRTDWQGGDLISLIEYLKGYTFTQTLQWICKIIDIDYIFDIKIKDKKPSETYKLLKQYNRFNKNVSKEKIILNENVLNQFIKKPHELFINDGISIKTQYKYEVMYDIDDNRIVFPIRDDDGNLLSVKGRSCIDSDDIPKYIHYYPLSIKDYLFGLHLNYWEILNKNEVILFEAEKSVLQCDSFGINNAVAIGTNKLSDEKIKKILSLKCDVVFAFDKGIELEEMLEQANKFKKYTNIKIILDINNILENKMSPSDKGRDVFLQLYNNKIKVGEDI